MKIKRYLDKDMRHVLRRVREDQGPDAVILSNRRVEEGIEVIAAIDYDEALVRHAVGKDNSTDATSETTIDSDALAQLAQDDFEPEPPKQAEIVAANLQPEPLKDMQDEISSLRGLLETQLSGLVWRDSADRSPMRAQMLRNLARIGITPDIAAMIIDRLEPIADVKRLWDAPLMTLAQALPVRDGDLMKEGGTFALIGPTGVGKTTTIAKIAARFALAHGADDVALISADSFRIGAKEHLMAFANIIGSKVYSASNNDELTDLLMRLSRKKLILIDTEGRSPRDRDLANRLAAYGDNAERVRFFLTLSAATQEAALDEAIRQFSQVPLEGAIITKVDEAAQLGCILSAMIRHDLPACWIADGQRIPDDLYAAARKKMWLVNRAVDCLEHTRPRLDEQTMAQHYSQASVGHA